MCPKVMAPTATDAKAVTEAVETALINADSAKRKHHSESTDAKKRMKLSEHSGGGNASGSGGGAAAPNESKRDFKSAPPVQLSILTVEGVSEYLRSIGKPFEPYIDTFASNCINGAALCDLNDSLLSKLGVSNEFHRIRILADVKSAQRTPHLCASRFGSAAAAASGGGGGGGYSGRR